LNDGIHAVNQRQDIFAVQRRDKSMVQHGQGVLRDIRSFFPQLFYFELLSVESWKRLEYR